jgi:uncharacterized protein YheU (UPF0270 family)
MRTDQPTVTTRTGSQNTGSQNLPGMLSNLRAMLRDGCDPGDIGRTLSLDIRAGRVTRRQANALAVLVWGPEVLDIGAIPYARIRRQYRDAGRVVFGE